MQNQGSRLKIKEAAKYLNVSVDTLRRWHKKGVISPLRSPTGHRYFTKEDLDKVYNQKYNHPPHKIHKNVKKNDYLFIYFGAFIFLDVILIVIYLLISRSSKM